MAEVIVQLPLRRRTEHRRVYLTSGATAIAVGRPAVKQAVLERFPVAQAKLAPNLKCTRTEGCISVWGKT